MCLLKIFTFLPIAVICAAFLFGTGNFILIFPFIYVTIAAVNTALLFILLNAAAQVSHSETSGICAELVLYISSSRYKENRMLKDIITKDTSVFKDKKGFICDMDGVIYHGNRLLDGAREFVDWLYAEDKKFLFLTNSSERSPLELKQKLSRLGLDIGVENFYTSALATASFLASQTPGGSAYGIGEPGLVYALYEAGISMNDFNPDYVVVGESRSYNIEKLERAVKLVLNGAKLIGTNTDLTGPSESGIIPACRALIAPIELVTGKSAYFVGKPNPLIMRNAMKKLGCHRTDTLIIGDRMDTDIIAGIQTEVDTVLVLSGVTNDENINQFSYRPHFILNNVGEICK